MEVWFATRTQHVIQGRKASTDMLFRWICVFRHCMIWYINSNECNCESIWHTWGHHQVRLVISWWDVYHIGVYREHGEPPFLCNDVMKNWILQRVTLGMGPAGCSLKDCAKLKMIDLGLASRFKRSALAHLLCGTAGSNTWNCLLVRFLHISTTVWINVSV